MLNRKTMYRKAFLTALVLVSCISIAFAQNAKIEMEGVYQGRDLYVKNPFSEAGVGYCVFQVEVNGKVTSDETNSSAFAVDMEALGLKVGDPVTIVLKHRDTCRPTILNPESIKPLSTFDVVEISVTGNGKLTWTTKNERGKLPYIIEQYRWNKWVKAGEVMGVGTSDVHTYTFKLEPHSGLNKVRVKQVDHTGEARTSIAREFVNPRIPEVEFSPKKPTDKITFTHPTRYEIFDQYGNLIKADYGEQIDVSNLPTGEYYLNYDNSFGDTFTKK